jgi:DNA-binding NarL/FixJ family response regulator
MAKIKILIADNSFLIRQGLRAIIEKTNNLILAGEAEKAEGLNEKLMLYNPDGLVFDYSSRYFCVDDIAVIRQYFPMVNILAITSLQSKQAVSNALGKGVMGHLLKDCGKDEIIEAINYTAKGQKFFCGKIIDILTRGEECDSSVILCDGIKLSDREIEIVRLIADGMTTRRIANKLFLSAHTVATHRRNIM